MNYVKRLLLAEKVNLYRMLEVTNIVEFPDEYNDLKLKISEIDDAQKILDAQSESLNVSSNEQQKEVCNHQFKHIYDEQGKFWKCSECGANLQTD